MRLQVLAAARVISQNEIAQVYDHNLNQKQVAIEFYEKYLDEGRTEQQLFNPSEGSFSPHPLGVGSHP